MCTLPVLFTYRPASHTLHCPPFLQIVKKGDAELPGLTDEEKPRLRGPKRASKIRKLFNLTKVWGKCGKGHASRGAGCQCQQDPQAAQPHEGVLVEGEWGGVGGEGQAIRGRACRCAVVQEHSDSQVLCLVLALTAPLAPDPLCVSAPYIPSLGLDLMSAALLPTCPAFPPAS